MVDIFDKMAQMEIPPGAFNLAIEQYLIVLDEEAQKGDVDALIEYESLLAWKEEREAVVREAVEAAWVE